MSGTEGKIERGPDGEVRPLCRRAIVSASGPIAQRRLSQDQWWTDWGLAVHEAAHAVISHILGRTPFLITIVADETALGTVTFCPNPSPIVVTDAQALDLCAYLVTGGYDVAEWDRWGQEMKRHADDLVGEHWSLILGFAQEVCRKRTVDRAGFLRWWDSVVYFRHLRGIPAPQVRPDVAVNREEADATGERPTTHANRDPIPNNSGPGV